MVDIVKRYEQTAQLPNHQSCSNHLPLHAITHVEQIGSVGPVRVCIARTLTGDAPRAKSNDGWYYYYLALSQERMQGVVR